MGNAPFRRFRFAREAIWLLPFIMIGIIMICLTRPSPVALSPTGVRKISSADGKVISVDEPFRGVVLTWGAWTVGDYLQHTRAPETVLVAGGQRERKWSRKYDLMGRIFPQILNDTHWDLINGDSDLRSKTEIETLLTYNPGAYLGNDGHYGMIPILRSVGMPAFYTYWNSKSWDEARYSTARTETMLVGHPEFGEALIARYKQANDDLDRELRTVALASRPRALMLGSSLHDWSYFYIKSVLNDYQTYFLRAGVENASQGLSGEHQDSERIIAMDPDIIFLTGSRDFPLRGESPQEFMRDPRWRDLKAVKEKRVYRMFGGGGLGGLIFQPLYDRFMAEIAHPDLLQPKLRQLLRDRILTEFNYRLSDDEIDEMLNVDENSGSAGAERFTRNYIPQKPQELKQ